MMRKNLYLFILLMIICSITTLATAQVTKVVIRGVVTAAIDKVPLPGAHVMLLNKDGRVVGNAIADMDGNYSMRVETRAGDNLVVSYTGMKLSLIHICQREALIFSRFHIRQSIIHNDCSAKETQLQEASHQRFFLCRELRTTGR